MAEVVFETTDRSSWRDFWLVQVPFGPGKMRTISQIALQFRTAPDRHRISTALQNLVLFYDKLFRDNVDEWSRPDARWMLDYALPAITLRYVGERGAVLELVLPHTNFAYANADFAFPMALIFVLNRAQTLESIQGYPADRCKWVQRTMVYIPPEEP